MRVRAVWLLALSACVRGPELYPDTLSLPAGAPAVRRVFVSGFYQLAAPRAVDVAVERMPESPRVAKKVDVAEEMAARLSAAGLPSEARADLLPGELKSGEVLLRGVLAKRGREGGVGWIFAAVPTVATAWLFYALAKIMPVTTPYTFDCRYEYYVEIVGPGGRVVLAKRGEITAEYSTTIPTAKLGKCQAPSPRAFSRLKAAVVADLADYLAPVEPSSAPASAPASAPSQSP
jgi:hypothetical protein